MAVTVKSQKRPLEIWQDPNAKPYIQIENVSKHYDGVTALRHVSLSIYEREFFALLGPSGCGKTSLLRILSGLEKPSEGRIWIDGIDVTNWPAYRRPVNMMFQSYALFPHMNVYDNIAFGLQFEKLNKKDIEERVHEALNLVQMKDFIHRKPHQLSGGQKQRVALARSIAKHPKLILLDEPLAALDKRLREQTQFELVDIQERVGITFVMVTHDQEEALTMSTRVAVMREGEVAQVGMPHEVYEFPNSRYVAEFIGTVNMFDGIVTHQSNNFVFIESQELGCKLKITCTATTPLGSHVAVALRPEKIKITKEIEPSEFNMTKGIVTEIAYLGDMSIYHVKIPSGKIIQASLPNLLRITERDVTWDDEVFLTWQPENGVVLSI